MSNSLSRRALTALTLATLTLSACSDDGVSAEPVVSSFVMVSGSPQSITAGASSTPLVVRVLDQKLKPMAGLTVTWAITSTVTGSLVANTTTTNAAGESSVVANAGLTPGAMSVRATITGQSPVSFAITITAPNNPPPQDLRDSEM